MIDRLLKLLISIVFYVIYKGVVLSFYLVRKPFPATIVVLTYHSVKPGQHSKFDKHMDQLTKVGCPVFADVPNPLSNGQHHIAVTFDDGFKSFLTNALPVMRARKIPATVFVTTGYLGKKPGWVCDPNHENASEVLITGKQLRELPNHLIAIGSHCVTHPHLAEIDKHRATSELIYSKKTLEELLDTQITMLSLPHGSHNREVIELSRKAGYERVFLNIPTFPSSRIGGYVMGRIDVSLDDWLIEYRLKFLGAYQWLPFAVLIKRKLLNFTRTIFSRS